MFCDLHPHSELRDGHFKIKYRSLIHKPEGQVVYLPKGQGMKKAVIQCGVGQVKAVIKSGPKDTVQQIRRSEAVREKNLKLQLRKDNNASPGVKIKRNKKKTGNGIIWFPHKQKLYEWIKMQ